MEYVNLGASGLKVSRLCLGCMSFGASNDWMIGEDESRAMVAKAWDAGVNFYDTADVYSGGESEEILGRALKALNIPRERVVIASKVYQPMTGDVNGRGLSRKHIMDSIDASLKRLGTDYVDLYQIHRPDYETPIEETLEALNDIVRAGKVRYIGASTMFAWEFMKALSVSERRSWAKFVSMQPQYNLLYREEEREMLPLCLDQGIGVIPWSPLARGFLAGNRSRAGKGETERAKTDGFADNLYYTDADFDVVDALTAVAKGRGEPNMQVALAWVLSKPAITAPIIGATKLSHLDDAVVALSIKLTAEDIAALEAPYKPRAINDHAPPPMPRA